MTLALPFFNLNVRPAAAGLAALLLTACPPAKPDETGTDGESSGDATAGGSTTSGGTTPTTSDGTMGSDSTADGSTTTTGDSTAGTTTTTGEVPPELLAACTAACEKFFECIMPPPFPSMAECIAGCTADADGTPECVAASVAFDECIAGFDCPAFEEAVTEEEFGECSDEFEATESECVTCEGGVGFGEDGCALSQVCPDLPSQEIFCEGDTCTCRLDNMPLGTCPADGVCAEDPQEAIENMRMLAAECCGFEL